MDSPPDASAAVGRPSSTRRIIVNADDFGLSSGVNAGVVEAHRNGILTSATLLANGPRFEEAVAMAAAAPGLGVGLHLNLVRGRPLSPAAAAPLLVGADGLFRPFRLRRPAREFLEQARAEYRRQFERVLAAGLSPSHIDFEKHHAFQAGLYDLACELAAEYGVPAVRCLREPVAWAVRRMGWPGWRRLVMASALRVGVAALGSRRVSLARPDRLLGQAHIGGMTEEAWLRLIRHVPEGTSEIMTHPGRPGGTSDPAAEEMGTSWLAAAREQELRALVSQRVREAVSAAGIQTIGFRELCTEVR